MENWQRFIEESETQPEFLYHVTYLFNLERIVKQGLNPSWKTGKTFLTEWGGVGYWLNKNMGVAKQRTDVRFVPVVIKVDLHYVRLNTDKAGSENSKFDSFYTQDSVEYEDLLFWNSKKWIALEHFRLDQMTNLGLNVEIWNKEGDLFSTSAKDLEFADDRDMKSSVSINHEAFIPKSP